VQPKASESQVAFSMDEVEDLRRLLGDRRLPGFP
jgi:hypothetical protein